jgi:hypothetical protein
MFLPYIIHNAIGAAPLHQSHQSMVIKSGHFQRDVLDNCCANDSIFDSSDTTILHPTGFHHDFSDNVSIKEKNSFS